MRGPPSSATPAPASILQSFSPFTSRIYLMVCLPSMLYLWNLLQILPQFAAGPATERVKLCQALSSTS